MDDLLNQLAAEIEYEFDQLLHIGYIAFVWCIGSIICLALFVASAIIIGYAFDCLFPVRSARVRQRLHQSWTELKYGTYAGKSDNTSGNPSSPYKPHDQTGQLAAHDLHHAATQHRLWLVCAASEVNINKPFPIGHAWMMIDLSGIQNDNPN